MTHRVLWVAALAGMVLMFVVAPAGADLGEPDRVRHSDRSLRPKRDRKCREDALVHGVRRCSLPGWKPDRETEREERQDQGVPVPTANSGPNEITSSHGTLWFTEDYGNQIGRIKNNGKITEFDLPAGGGGPYDIVEGPDGNLWYTRADVSGPCGSPDSGNAIGRMTPTGSVVEYPLPNSDSRPLGIAAGRDGNLWFAECSGNRIGRIAPTGTIDEQDIPSADSEPYGIASGPQNSLWFTEYSGNRVGRLPALTAKVLKGSRVPRFVPSPVARAGS